MLRNTIMEGGLLIVSPLSVKLDHHPFASYSQLLNQYIYGLNKLNQKRFSKLPTPGPAAVTQR
jgi:hypothetical protein